MKKIVLWLMSTLTVMVLLFGYHTSTSSTSAAAVRGGNASLASPVQGGTDSSASSDTFSTSDGDSSSASSSSSAAAASSSAAPRSSSAAGGATATTKVTGAVASTRWGPVQVQLSVANRKITNVAVLQYPTGNGRDQEINSYALPQLIQETLKAQSSNIDMISGATYTSDGYLQSLQSALDKAGI